jgi:hypothetical protein
VPEELGARWHSNEWWKKVEMRSSPMNLGEGIGAFRREGEKLSGAAKGKDEEEEGYLYQERDSSHRWIKRKGIRCLTRVIRGKIIYLLRSYWACAVARVPRKVEDVCPHLRNVLNYAVSGVHISVNEQNPHLPNTTIVAIVSIDVTILEISTEVLRRFVTKEFS